LDDPHCKIRVGKRRGEFVVETGAASLPVVCVSWPGAAAYAQWLGKRLPTEVEWEKAARGTDGREWPWGNELTATPANISRVGFPSHGLRAVGGFFNGARPYGCLDMAGNVWEWTASDDAESG